MKNILFLLFSALLIVFVHSQILAIDYGTMYVKAALVHTGAGKSFSIVENPKSNRKFINSMGIYNQERFYEADTFTKRSRGPSNCFIYSRLLVDLHLNPSQLERVKKELILDYISQPESDQLMGEFILKGLPEGTQSLSLLEAVAMMLKYIKLQAEKQAKGNLKDVVLTVPSYWNLKQRKFMIDAATMADMYVLSLIHENTAAALNYALSQRSTNNTQKILFYNVGANSFQMTLAQFRQVKSDKSKNVESVFVLDHYGHSYLGGLTLDYLLADFFAQKFQTKYKKSLNQRGRIRLLAECEKTKNVLSANKEATVFIEGIMDGIDFSATIKRAQFEKIADEVFQKLIKPVKRFLFDNDMKAEQLTAVELIGGGTRVPKLQQLLGQIVGNSSIIGSHINGDEAMVFGAAFYGANSSRKFKIKGINLYDSFDFEIRIVLRNADESLEEGNEGYYFKNATLFKKRSRFGMTKEVTFKSRQNIIVDLYKEDDSGIQLLNSHKLESIKTINESQYKISLTFEINPVQIVKLNEAKYLYSKQVVQSYTEKVRKTVPKNESQEEEERQQQTASEENEKEQSEKEQTSQAEEQQTDDDEQKKQKKSKKSKADKKKKQKEKIQYETVQRTKNVTKNFQNELSFEKTFTISASQDQEITSKGRKLLSVFEDKEAEKKKLAEAKNKLEALIYEVRQRFEQEEFLKFSQKEEHENLEKLVGLKSQWYEDTYSNNAEDYIREHKQLNEPLEKIKKRIIQHRQRDEVKKRALNIVQDYEKETTKIRKGKGWITEEQVEELNNNLESAKKKINNLFSQIEKTPLNEDSIYRNKDMIREADKAKDKFFALKGKLKPKGWKEQKQEKKDEKKEQKSKQKDSVNEDQL